MLHQEKGERKGRCLGMHGQLVWDGSFLVSINCGTAHFWRISYVRQFRIYIHSSFAFRLMQRIGRSTTG
jgi:hypothetical protein